MSGYAEHEAIARFLVRFVVFALTGIALLVWLSLSSCAMLNPTAADVLKKFCDFHSSEIGQVLLSSEQLKAGAVVCGAVGARLGTPD